MESTNVPSTKESFNWGGLDRDVQLLRVAAKEIHDAGPRACAPYADRIHLLAELADCISRNAYRDIQDAAQRAADTRAKRERDYDI